MHAFYTYNDLGTKESTIWLNDPLILNCAGDVKFRGGG